MTSEAFYSSSHLQSTSYYNTNLE